MTDIVESVLTFAGPYAPLAGTIYRSAEAADRQPGVLVTGSWLTVQQQMPRTYARALAERGFTAFTFDFTGFGSSGGEPRTWEAPTRKMADLEAAARFLGTLSSVAPTGVGHLGVCASAQYGFPAAAYGAPLASVASVAGWFHDTPSLEPFYGGAEGIAMRLERANRAAQTMLETGEVIEVPAYEVGNDRAGMFFELDYYGSADRGAVAEWPNRMAEASWSQWLLFDGISPAIRSELPALFVHSDDCVFPETVRRIVKERIAPTDLVWGTGSQIDFYDQPEQVRFAADAAAEHFRRTLEAMPDGRA